MYRSSAIGDLREGKAADSSLLAEAVETTDGAME